MPGTGNGHRQLQEPLARGEASSCGNWGSINPVGKLRHGGVGLSRVPSVSPQAVTWCQGSVFLEQQQPTVELSCEKAPAVVRRGRNGSVSPLAVPGVPSSSPPKSDTALCPPSSAAPGSPRSRVSLVRSSSASEASSSAVGFGSGTGSTSRHPNPEGTLLCPLLVSPPCAPHPAASLPINVPASLPVSPSVSLRPKGDP